MIQLSIKYRQGNRQEEYIRIWNRKYYLRLVFPYLILLQNRQNKRCSHYFSNRNSITYLQKQHILKFK